jgi:hypothetical protein
MTPTNKWLTGNGREWTLYINDRMRAAVRKIDDRLWTGLYADHEGGQVRRLREKFETAEDAREAIDVGIREGARSLVWRPLGKLARHRAARATGATVETDQVA